MINDIIANIVISKKIEFNRDEKYHNIFQVVNQVFVPILPAVVITDVLVKILIPVSHMDDLAGIEPEIHILDKDNKLINNYFLPPLENLRMPDNIPGIDIQTNIRFPVKVEGIYEYKLFVGESFQCSNYISVYSSELRN